MRSAANFDANPARTAPAGLRIWRRRASAWVRLVCWPWCGAGASVFRHLANALPDSVELQAMQLPGREDRYGEPPLRRMEAMVQASITALAGHDDRPLVFFGHSMGAVLAGEAAHAWRGSSGREPALLIASGHGAPALPQADAARWHTADETALLRNIAGLGGTPAAVLDDPGLWQMLLPTLRADYEALETHIHVARPPLRCPLVACAGSDDTVVSAEGLQRWAGFTSGPFETQLWPGGHFYLVDRAAELARQIARWIDRHAGALR